MNDMYYHNDRYFCVECGHELDALSIKCPKCNTFYICPHCGKFKCDWVNN